jgi:hypothetical protein
MLASSGRAESSLGAVEPVRRLMSVLDLGLLTAIFVVARALTRRRLSLSLTDIQSPLGQNGRGFHRNRVSTGAVEKQIEPTLFPEKKLRVLSCKEKKVLNS